VLTLTCRLRPGDGCGGGCLPRATGASASHRCRAPHHCPTARLFRTVFACVPLIALPFWPDDFNGRRLLRWGPHQAGHGRVTCIRACPQGQRSVCLGIGGGALPALWAARFPAARMDAVDCDPAVVQLSRELLSLSAPVRCMMPVPHSSPAMPRCVPGMVPPGPWACIRAPAMCCHSRVAHGTQQRQPL
jgi:hypothetical protein